MKAHLATRLAERWRLPIAGLGALSAAIAVTNLFALLPDAVAMISACLIGILGIGLFLCEVFDSRFHSALSALNAARREQARVKGWAARLFGVGLPLGDRLLFAIDLTLLATSLIAGNVLHQLPAAALSFAGFWLVGVTQIALMARDYPDDRFVA